MSMAHCADISTHLKTIYSSDNIKESRRYASVTEIDHIDAQPPYHEIFNAYIKANRPFILSNVATRDWLSRKDWVRENGLPNLDFLKQEFGEALAPVADCGLQEYAAHPKTDMTVADYVDYWRDYREGGYPSTKPCLYLKDWHFSRAFPHYHAYTTPIYFLSDWLNEFWDSRADGEDDYRFVYMGPKGSWTPFHADVFRSFSWSANICGLKKWIFYPPGTEDEVTDRLGNVALDVTSPDLHDAEKYPYYHGNIPSMEVIQKPGEIIFVPTGWFHQVINLEDCISINHNWLNGCNVDLFWDFLKTSLSDVEKEIADCREMEGWQQQCQLILKATSGIEYMEFYHFLRIIAENRFRVLDILTIKENSAQSLSALTGESDHSNRCDGVQSENSKTHDRGGGAIPLSGVTERLKTINICGSKGDTETDTESMCSCSINSPLDEQFHNKTRKQHTDDDIRTGHETWASVANRCDTKHCSSGNPYVDFSADNLHKLPETVFPRGLRARLVQDYRHVLTLDHAVFDLRCIQTIVRDMLETDQFSVRLSETPHCDPRILLEKINSVL